MDWEDRISTKYQPYPSQELAEDFNVIINYDRKNKLLNFNDGSHSTVTYDCEDLEEFNIFLDDFLRNI